MAKAKLVARILVIATVSLLGAYSATLLFPRLFVAEALLAATVVAAAIARPRLGLGVAVVASAVAVAQTPRGLGGILGLVLAAMVLEAGYELLAERSLSARRECSSACRYATLASLSVVYGSLLASAYLGALLLARIYDSLLSMQLPGALAEFWQLASKSIAVRVLIYTAMIGIVYWVSSRLVAPLFQALASPGYVVERMLSLQLRLEESMVERMETWYHRVFPRVLGILVGFFASPLAYPAALGILRAIRVESPGMGLEAAMIAAVAWLVGLIGYNLGYSAARMIMRGLDWSKTALGGALALLAVIVLSAAVSQHPLSYLVSELVGLAKLVYAPSTSLHDPRYVTAFYTRVEGLEKYYRDLEELLRFLIRLFWS